MSQPHPGSGMDQEDEDTTLSSRQEKAFLKIHGMRMRREATEYGRKIPSLNWIYVGQLPFSIEGDSNRREAVSLTDQLDDCYTLLARTFGLPA